MCIAVEVVTHAAIGVLYHYCSINFPFDSPTQCITYNYLCSCIYVYIATYIRAYVPGGVVIITTLAPPLPTELVATTENV